MERSLYFSALALGLVAWACSLLLAPHRAKTAENRLTAWLPASYLLAAGIVPLLALFGSLRTRPPFAGGQGLGLGLLLGGMGAIVTLLTLSRSLNVGAPEEASGMRNGVGMMAPFALAVVTVAIPLLWMRNVVVDALLGEALGWLASTLLLLAGINAARYGSRVLSLSLTAGVGFTASLCAIEAVGEMGGNVRVGNSLAGIPWSVPLLLLGAGMVFVLLLCALPPNLLRLLPGTNGLVRASSFLSHDAARLSAPHIVRWLVGSLLFVGLGTQFGHRLGGQPNVFRLLGMGATSSGLAWWMLAGQSRSAANGYGNTGWQRMALPTLVIMAAGMIAFQMLAGVGFAIMLLGAWLTMGIALVGAQQSESELETTENVSALPRLAASKLLQLLLFGTLLLLYRLFQVRFRDDLQNVLLPDHYALLGFIIGAAVPAALAEFQGGGEKERRRRGEEEKGTESLNSQPSTLNLLRMLLAGVLLLFVPSLLLMLFGTKCLLCLFFGLALATVIGNGMGHDRSEADANPDGFRPVPSEWLIGLFALGIGLAVTQWTAHVLPVTLMARADKTRLLTNITGVVAALLVLAALLNRPRRASEFGQKGGAK